MLSDNLEETPWVRGGAAAREGDQDVQDPVPSKHVKEVVEGRAVHHEEALVVLIRRLAPQDEHELLHHTEAGEDHGGRGDVEQRDPAHLCQLGLAKHPHDEGDGIEVVEEF